MVQRKEDEAQEEEVLLQMFSYPFSWTLDLRRPDPGRSRQIGEVEGMERPFSRSERGVAVLRVPLLLPSIYSPICRDHRATHRIAKEGSEMGMA